MNPRKWISRYRYTGIYRKCRGLRDRRRGGTAPMKTFTLHNRAELDDVKDPDLHLNNVTRRGC